MITLLEKIRDKKAFICDMDGVLYHGNRMFTGVTARNDVDKFSYKPSYVLESVAEIASPRDVSESTYFEANAF
jgi:NagD protein